MAGGLCLLLGAAGCGDDGSGPAEPVCSDGEIVCSDDGSDLKVCQGGQWQVTHCMADQMKLCEAGQCVEPWRYGEPSFDDCAGEPLATAESLLDKAKGYEKLAGQLYVSPELGWMLGAVLPCNGSDCSTPAVPETQAGYQDVEQWRSGENDGLWSALYLTAEAFRYAATGEAEALAMLKVLLEGQRKRMAITGVEGLYTRQLIPPNVSGIACPVDPSRYLPDKEKDDNQWVRVGSDGCVQVVDPASMQFVSTDHCGLGEFAGWCWLDNVSQDEYSGHMLAHAAVARLVDDPEVQAANSALLAQVGHHLVEHQLELYDWDGRRTEHGKLWAGTALSGFAAAMSLAFVEAAAFGTDDPAIDDFLYGCLLSEHTIEQPCIDKVGASVQPYAELVGNASLYLGCSSNWNNFSMHMLSLHTLLMLEQDPARRATIQVALSEDMFNKAGTDRPLSEQNNALFDFMYAADKALGPASDGPALAAVKNGVCMLRQFPASSHQRAASCPPDKCVAVCDDRFGNPMTDYPRPVAERCLGTFLWWGSPYSVGECSDDLRTIYPPADYLLAYWMGRYYGFIDETM